MYGQKMWTKIGKVDQNREKQEWAKEQPKLDNARGLRGTYFIDPDDTGCVEILKMRGEKIFFKKKKKTYGTSHVL